ncbi:MAG: hypothetical protein ABSH14_14240 [Verrucomicrobiia bacterium]|jgi:hypothetical protein
MRKSRSRFALFPQPIRNEINRKLDDGWPYERIREWLFAQTADRDIPALDLKTGDSYSLIWTRTTPDEKLLIRNFGVAMSGWFHTHYPRWRDEQADREEVAGLVDRVEELSTAAGEKAREGSATGGTLLIRSLLMDAIDHIHKGKNDPTQLARLAHAWARMNHSGLELEKFKLQSQKAIDIGLQAVCDEFKTKPDVLAAFQKFREIVKANLEPTS